MNIDPGVKFIKKMYKQKGKTIATKQDDGNKIVQSNVILENLPENINFFFKYQFAETRSPVPLISSVCGQSKSH